MISWEKSDLEPASTAQYLGMLTDTILERAYLVDSRIVRFRDLANSFFSPSASTHKDVAAGPRSHGISGVLRSSGSYLDASSAVKDEVSLVS